MKKGVLSIALMAAASVVAFAALVLNVNDETDVQALIMVPGLIIVYVISLVSLPIAFVVFLIKALRRAFAR